MDGKRRKGGVTPPPFAPRGAASPPGPHPAVRGAGVPPRDPFHRVIDYLRVSVTDRCNLRCIYCMPEEGTRKIVHRDILRYEEIARVAAAARKMGIRHVRITGGEPLARRNVTRLVSMLRDEAGIGKISMTTNGVFLGRYVGELREAGLGRVNVSLDSLDARRYREITRGGEISSVLEGISAAHEAGMTPVKINVVPMRGFNEDEIEAFAGLTTRFPYHVRFIEFMPLAGGDFWRPERVIPSAEIRARIERLAPLEEVRTEGAGPSRNYRMRGAEGIIGIISPLTDHFCSSCNRLRMTSDGRLRPCLLADEEIDLKPVLRGGGSNESLEALMMKAVSLKPEGHLLSSEREGRRGRKGAMGRASMSGIGG